MQRQDYLTMFERIASSGMDARVHWATGPNAGRCEPWDGLEESLPGTPSRLYAGCGEASDGLYFAESLKGRPQLLILGAGHVGTAVAAIAATLGFRIVVVDARPEFADPARLPAADEVICAPYEQALAQLPPYANSYVAIVTSGHRLDRQCAALCLRRPYEYLGMIGSRAKVASVRTALAEMGFTPEQIGTIHAPIGLPLGGREPAEIAVSICAELIAVRAQRAAHAFDPDVQAAIEELAADPARRGMLATIVGHGGSVPRGAGSRMLVGPGGPLAGSVGGGAVEAAVIARGRELAGVGAPGTTDLLDYDLSDHEGADLGMICGGRVRVLFEVL